MSKIVMRYLMRQYSSKLLIVSFLQQTRRYVELPATRVGGIDAGIINNTELREVSLAWLGSRLWMAEARVSVDAGRCGEDVVSTTQPAVRPTNKTSTEAGRL